MYIFMNQAAQAIEQNIKISGTAYFNIEKGTLSESLESGCIQLPKINPCDIIGAYLEYANDINLKRRYRCLDEASKKSFDAFSAIAREEGLRKDWESFKNADLQRIAHDWCLENSLQMQSAESIETPA